MEEEEEEVWWLVEEKDDVLGVGTYWYWGKEVGGKMYFEAVVMNAGHGNGISSS